MVDKDFGQARMDYQRQQGLDQNDRAVLNEIETYIKKSENEEKQEYKN